MQENNITNPHDQFFRTAMADKRVAQDFLMAWLPKKLCKIINFEQLRMEPRSYINDIRKESAVVVLFKPFGYSRSNILCIARQYK